MPENKIITKSQERIFKYTLVNMQTKYNFFAEQVFVRAYCKNINVLHRGMFYLLTPNTIKGETLHYVVQQKVNYDYGNFMQLTIHSKNKIKRIEGKRGNINI